MDHTTITLQTAYGPMDALQDRTRRRGPTPGSPGDPGSVQSNHHIRNVCQRLTAHGYVALAPELFHCTGQGVELGYTDMSQVMPHFSKLTNSGILMDIEAGLASLTDDPRVDPARIGVIGFCARAGSRPSWLPSARMRKRSSSSMAAGSLRARPGIALEPIIGDADRIHQPVLLMFEVDRIESIPAADIQEIDETLTRLGKPHLTVTMPDGGHGFACDERAAYHAPSNDEAWRITYEWLEGNL
ncbi:MAG: dienelactone hydrolase family protein [Vicinamibacterales bacterium]